MKRFKLSTEVLFSEDAIDALLEEKDENAVLITDKFMVDSGMADIILKKLSNCKEVSVFSEVVPDPPMDLIERGIAFLQEVLPLTRRRPLYIWLRRLTKSRILIIRRRSN